MKLRKKTLRVIIHHSLSKDVSALVITKWHRLRKFTTIGYHGVIHFDGTFERGRDIAMVGAHKKGSNHDSIGVCVMGDFSKHHPTISQYTALAEYIRSLRVVYGDISIEFHRDETEGHPCPGVNFNRDEFLASI
jgi:N-acetylmuramoyl-L-alanine amidase